MDNVIHTDWQRKLITLTVMLVAILEVIDMTIVNVALPSMMGTLGANSDQITWVLTSYIVSAAIFMPITGLLVDKFGRKRLLLTNIIGFGLSSMLCGLATSLGQIVFFRMLQGAFGASLVPLSQYIMRDTYPRDKTAKAMAIWGIGIMAGPVIGPSLGGYITEALNWRWIFYINFPLCLLSLGLAHLIITESTLKKVKIDWQGLGWMTLAIASLQLFLDRGNSLDWFQSNTIVVLFFTWIISFAIFIYRGRRTKNHIINLNLYRNKQFSLSQIILILFCAINIGIVSLQPLMLETYMGYPTAYTGLLMAPRALASAVGMMLVSQLINRVNPRYLIWAGLGLGSLGCYCMTFFNANTPAGPIMLSSAIQGLGMGLTFVPISTLAFAQLPESAMAEASGLFSFARSIGVSIGISCLSTLITRRTQMHWQSLVDHLPNPSVNLNQWLAQHHFTLNSPQAIGFIKQQLFIQSGVLAYIDVFYLCAFLTFLTIGISSLLKGASKTNVVDH